MHATPNKVSVLTGGVDWHYAGPLTVELARRGLDLEVVGSSEFLELPEFRDANLAFVNAHGHAYSKRTFYQKVRRIFSVYANLGRYAARTDAQIFHILWHNKFKLFDRIVVTSYYKLLGKKLLFTVHNVDIDERDGKSGLTGRASLKFMYGLMDHIFVHTDKMKTQLQATFDVPSDKITVHPFGMNTVPPDSSLTRAEARLRLGVGPHEKVALFFGNVAPYKGLEYLIQALDILQADGLGDVKLIIAGRVKNRQASSYCDSITKMVAERGLHDRVRMETRFIPDEEIEVFMKASDVCVLPYVYVYQSGVLILAYRYGLPTVATDAGSMSEDIVEGRTGFVCRSADAADLARALRQCFTSRLVADRETTRQEILRFAESKYSWKSIAATIAGVYQTVGQAGGRAS